MKFSLAIFFFLLFGFTASLQAQTANQKPKRIETSEFSVKGVCDMCEARIEKAALIKGVKFVEWNKEAQTVKVIYASKKVSEEDIHLAIAGVGHDTEKMMADDGAYQTLPDCCAYRDGVEVH